MSVVAGSRFMGSGRMEIVERAVFGVRGRGDAGLIGEYDDC